jgi:RNA polymerase sigma-70 factor (sigma-E family)
VITESSRRSREVVRGEGSDDFDAFFRREYHALVGLALVLTGDRATAEDLAQDALVAAHRKWDDLAHYDDPGAWVRHVVANRSASVWRRRSRELRAMTRLRARPVEIVDGLDAHDDEFWDSVRALPARQAQCVALRYLEDRAVEEIADILEIAPGTVRVHLHEARKTLAVRLGETDGEES